jgi:glycosyltransferase involved in cell wall biosynthesis
MSVYRKESSSCLRECLESLAAQTRLPDEVVIVEDGPIGSDLRHVIASFRDFLPIVVVQLPSNLGLGAALGEGLRACTGEFIARMDSDDVCAVDRFRRQLDFLAANPEVDVAGAAIAEFDESYTLPHSIRRAPASGTELQSFARSRNPMNHMTVMMRKSSLVSAGGYLPFLGFEDYHLWARMLMMGFRLHNLPDVLVYVRCGNGMQNRRGGFYYLKQEIRLQMTFRRMGFLTWLECARNVLMRSPSRLAPPSLRTIIYRRFLRNNPAAPCKKVSSRFNDAPGRSRCSLVDD